MEQNREIKINQLPSKTWHWLHVNEAVVTVPEKMEEAAIKIEETDQLVKVKVAAGEGSLPVKAAWQSGRKGNWNAEIPHGVGASGKQSYPSDPDMYALRRTDTDQ